MYSILFIRVVNEEHNAKDPTDLGWKIRLLNAIRKVWQSVLFRRYLPFLGQHVEIFPLVL